MAVKRCSSTIVVDDSRISNDESGQRGQEKILECGNNASQCCSRPCHTNEKEYGRYSSRGGIEETERQWMMGFGNDQENYYGPIYIALWHKEKERPQGEGFSKQPEQGSTHKYAVSAKGNR